MRAPSKGTSDVADRLNSGTPRLGSSVAQITPPLGNWIDHLPTATALPGASVATVTRRSGCKASDEERSLVPLVTGRSQLRVRSGTGLPPGAALARSPRPAPSRRHGPVDLRRSDAAGVVPPSSCANATGPPCRQQADQRVIQQLHLHALFHDTPLTSAHRQGCRIHAGLDADFRPTPGSIACQRS